MTELHPIQSRILQLAKKHSIASLGLRKIGRLIEVQHPQQVRYHLLQLQKKGLLDKSNSPLMTSGLLIKSDLISIPILGAASCGPANIIADQQPEGYLQVSKKILGSKKNIFAIKAVGYSMDRAKIQGQAINSGDYVLINRGVSNYQDGDYVLSVIDDMANVKKLRIDNQNRRFTLISESSKEIPPILIDESDKYLINGKVIEVVKPS